jgi:hypothetical protein
LYHFPIYDILFEKNLYWTNFLQKFKMTSEMNEKRIIILSLLNEMKNKNKNVEVELSVEWGEKKENSIVVSNMESTIQYTV